MNYKTEQFLIIIILINKKINYFFKIIFILKYNLKQYMIIKQFLFLKTNKYKYNKYIYVIYNRNII